MYPSPAVALLLKEEPKKKAAPAAANPVGAEGYDALELAVESALQYLAELDIPDSVDVEKAIQQAISKAGPIDEAALRTQVESALSDMNQRLIEERARKDQAEVVANAAKDTADLKACVDDVLARSPTEKNVKSLVQAVVDEHPELGIDTSLLLGAVLAQMKAESDAIREKDPLYTVRFEFRGEKVYLTDAEWAKEKKKILALGKIAQSGIEDLKQVCKDLDDSVHNGLLANTLGRLPHMLSDAGRDYPKKTSDHYASLFAAHYGRIKEPPPSCYEGLEICFSLVNRGIQDIAWWRTELNDTGGTRSITLIKMTASLAVTVVSAGAVPPGASLGQVALWGGATAAANKFGEVAGEMGIKSIIEKEDFFTEKNMLRLIKETGKAGAVGAVGGVVKRWLAVEAGWSEYPAAVCADCTSAAVEMVINMVLTGQNKQEAKKVVVEAAIKCATSAVMNLASAGKASDKTPPSGADIKVVEGTDLGSIPGKVVKQATGENLKSGLKSAVKTGVKEGLKEELSPTD
jgi:hypothetical protein